MEQLYSEAAGKFLADRLVSGRCPKCSYEVRCALSHSALSGPSLRYAPVPCENRSCSLYLAVVLQLLTANCKFLTRFYGSEPFCSNASEQNVLLCKVK